MRLTYLLYPGIEPIDLAPLGVFSMGRRVVPELEYELVAPDRSPVELTNGLTVLPSRTFGEVEKVDVLLVPGGGGWREAARNDAILAFIRHWAALDATLMSICTGSLILAASGVLDGLSATTKSRVVPPESPPIDDLGRCAGVTVESGALLVDNGRVITGGGVSLCIDATFYLLASRYGEEAAAQIAHIMEYDAARAANLARLPVVRPATAQPVGS
ncbi:DJ-1/PfpI family protein [Allopusillimonas ginsengisoli]|uniref:DJ-1/PfpI family protein n=1 Tax=Allopusillimonas ginsengisoli TaxID=453575 RepID=UPI00142FFF86|nr:DJ-1/PfpI family protein [Allopusillimonas ginsengisoli]